MDFQMDKKKWLFVGLAAAAFGVYVLLSRGGGGGGGASPSPIGSSTGMPDPNHTDTPYFNPSEQAAAGWANYYQADSGIVQRALDSIGGYANGAKFNSGIWEEAPGGYVNTGIKNPSAKGTFLSSEAAAQLGPQNKGPLAKGKTILQKVGDFVGTALQVYSASQGVPSGGTHSAASYGFPGVTGSNETAAHAYQTQSVRLPQVAVTTKQPGSIK